MGIGAGRAQDSNLVHAHLKMPATAPPRTPTGAEARGCGAATFWDPEPRAAVALPSSGDGRASRCRPRYRERSECNQCCENVPECSLWAASRHRLTIFSKRPASSIRSIPGPLEVAVARVVLAHSLLVDASDRARDRAEVDDQPDAEGEIDHESDADPPGEHRHDPHDQLADSRTGATEIEVVGSEASEEDRQKIRDRGVFESWRHDEYRLHIRRRLHRTRHRRRIMRERRGR